MKTLINKYYCIFLHKGLYFCKLRDYEKANIYFNIANNHLNLL